MYFTYLFVMNARQFGVRPKKAENMDETLLFSS